MKYVKDKRTLLERFLAQLRTENECFIWTGVISSKRYGSLYLDRDHGSISAHIFAFILHNKYYPKGEIHHKCKNKLCCNPEHLENLTSLEHRQRHAKTHCKNGHEIISTNRNKSRNCRICDKERYLKTKASKNAQNQNQLGA